MKKNRLMRVAAMLLVLTLVTSCFVGGTFAKYTSTATVTDTASVAKWDVLLGAEQIANASTTAVTINLFETINEEDTTSPEADVKSGKLIAPGTGGSFALNLTNKSEVDAQYTMVLSAAEANGDIPIEYSLDKSSWSSDITTLNADASLQDVALNMNATNQVTATVYWRWVFGTGSTDAADTALGIAAREGNVPQVTVTATITVEQVN